MKFKPFTYLILLTTLMGSCSDSSEEMNSIKTQNQELKNQLSELSTQMDSLKVLMEEKEESITDVNLSVQDNPNTNVNLSVPKDEGLETARKYIESQNYKLDFIKGEKGKKEGNCDIYRLVFEKEYGEKVMYLALVKEDCVTTLETSSPDNWDYSMLENKNQCGCYNVGGSSNLSGPTAH